jgi:hypothetical protein
VTSAYLPILESTVTQVLKCVGFNITESNISKDNPLDKRKDDTINSCLSRTLVSAIELLL